MSASRPALFARFPELRERLPWIPLAAGAPTPVEPLRAFGLERLFVKRDDRTSGVYGGNKVRKLEWILAEARRRNRKAVLTFGAWGSHHALATARFAREAGMRATLILWPQPRTPHVEAVLAASRATGARIVPARSHATIPIALACACAACVLAGEGWPYRIAPGGSDARGALGYVDCGLELAAQVAAGALPAPDFVYAAAGTCGTIAGLALGLGLAGLSGACVVGVRVVPAFIASAARTLGLIHGAAALLGAAGERAAAVPFEILGDQLGPGYGFDTPAAVAAREAARAAGLETETTYTAKALAGLAAFAAAPERRGKVHLYVHTLGQVEGRA